ncbi:MAG: hypothetical protein PHW82_11785 [Bacteroidales bacterium]|nr:hypothetical protein [Bacteroidales bacterium]
MKKILFLSIVLLCGYFALAQTVLFEDNFDSYTAGDPITTQSTDWTTWSGATTGGEAALISTAQANSGANSLNIIANNDMIYSFGNKTSGVYQVEFNYFVPTGSEAYFNLEHVFGVEWAFSCTFASGTMTLANGAATAPTFSYTEDTWLNFDIFIDLGNDLIKLSLGGTELASWTFSTLEGGGSGTNQLGCMNFFGPANNNYYVDDFVYTQIESGVAPPTIDITIAPITTATGDNETISFGNTGEEGMNFSAYPVFDDSFSAKNGSKDGVMSIDNGNFASSVGWTGEATGFVATRFAPEIVRPFMGQEVTSVEIGINHLPLNSEVTVYVWEKGGFITPGAATILSQKTQTVTMGSWNIIDLDSPILLDGEEIWIGYGFTQPVDSFCSGMDDAANISGANYAKFGPVWAEFTGIDNVGNWSIRAHVTGSSWPVWMSATPATGTVAAAGSQDITLSFDNTSLENGDYTGNIIIGCNDQESEWNEVPVTYTVFVGIDNVKQSVATYPNPTSDIFNIETTSTIENVEIYNTAGQLVNTLNVNCQVSQGCL